MVCVQCVPQFLPEAANGKAFHGMNGKGIGFGMVKPPQACETPAAIAGMDAVSSKAGATGVALGSVAATAGTTRAAVALVRLGLREKGMSVPPRLP